MPTIIKTSTAPTATLYGNQRKIDRCQNGVLWTVHEGGDQRFYFYYSNDNGATYVAGEGASYIDMAGVRNHTPNGSLFIDKDDYAHFVYKNSNSGFVDYRRGTPNAARTAWTWSLPTQISGSSTYYNCPDVVAHREGTGWSVHFVYSYYSPTSPGSVRAYHSRVTITSDGSVSAPVTLQIGGNYSTVSTHSYPSIDFHHTGDAKTVAGGTPHLYVGWSSGAAGAGRGIRFKKATYSAGVWAWGVEREIDSTLYIPNDTHWLTCMFDGSRVIMPAVVNTGSMVATRIYERDSADSTSTSRNLDSASPTPLTERLLSGSSTFDSAGNIYLFGANQDEAAGSKDLVYRKWTRATVSLGSEVVIDSSISNPYVSAKRGHSTSRIEYIYTDGNASPYSIMYDGISTNIAPGAPGSFTSPSSGEVVDTTDTVTIGAAIDPEGNTLQYQWDLSLNNGSTYTNKRATQAGLSWTYNYSTEIETTTAIWRVRAWDGLAWGPYRYSSQFTISHGSYTPAMIL